MPFAEFFCKLCFISTVKRLFDLFLNLSVVRLSDEMRFNPAALLSRHRTNIPTYHCKTFQKANFNEKFFNLFDKYFPINLLIRSQLTGK